VTKNIKKGEKFTINNVRSIRPGYGLKPSKIIDVIGKKSICDISRGTAMREDFIDEG
jgi:pseudaminic acid synthase